MSARQKIEEALKATPKISLDELQKQLPDIKPVTLKSDFYKLKRKLFGSKTIKKSNSAPKKKSNSQKVSEYLNKNVETSIKTLQTAFPDIKKSSLSAYLSLWRKEQNPKKKDKPAAKKMDLEKSKAKLAKPEKKKEKPVKAKSETAKIVKSEKTVTQTAKPVKKTKKLDKPKAKLTKKDSPELVESLKQTIAAQDKTIQTMNKSLDLSTPETNEEELKGMTLTEIKRIAVTFLKSIKELPAKMRR